MTLCLADSVNDTACWRVTDLEVHLANGQGEVLEGKDGSRALNGVRAVRTLDSRGPRLRRDSCVCDQRDHVVGKAAAHPKGDQVCISQGCLCRPRPGVGHRSRSQDNWLSGVQHLVVQLKPPDAAFQPGFQFGSFPFDLRVPEKWSDCRSRRWMPVTSLT